MIDLLRSTPRHLYATTLIIFAAWTFGCMDVSFPGLALPAISKRLHVSLSDLSYALGGFAFIELLVLLLGGGCWTVTADERCSAGAWWAPIRLAPTGEVRATLLPGIEEGAVP